MIQYAHSQGEGEREREGEMQSDVAPVKIENISRKRDMSQFSSLLAPGANVHFLFKQLNLHSVIYFVRCQ